MGIKPIGMAISQQNVSHSTKQETGNIQRDCLKNPPLSKHDSIEFLLFNYKGLNRLVRDDIYDVNCQTLIKTIEDVSYSKVTASGPG